MHTLVDWLSQDATLRLVQQRGDWTEQESVNGEHIEFLTFWGPNSSVMLPHPTPQM